MIHTQKWNSLEQSINLFSRSKSSTSSVSEAAEAVDPAKQPATVSLCITVKFLQQLRCHRKVVLSPKLTHYVFNVLVTVQVV